MQSDATRNAGFSQPLKLGCLCFWIMNITMQKWRIRNSLQIFKTLHELKKSKAFRNNKQEAGFSYTALKDQFFIL